MFERFTADTRQIIATAQGYASQSGLGAILPIHLLRALAEYPGLQKDFDHLSVDTKLLIPSVIRNTPQSREPAPNAKLRAEAITGIVKKSLKIALAQRSTQIEPSHLLLAVIDGGDEPVVESLQAAGLNPNQPIDAFAPVIEPAISEEFLPTDDVQPQQDNDGVGFQIIPASAKRGAPLRNGRKKESYLDNFADNLTAKAIEGKLDPVIGREKEVKQVVQILARRNKNNPVLIGEPGVGKTAVVEGLAQELLKDDAPKALKEKRIYTLDLTAVVAGTRYRGDFEERMKKIMKEVSQNPDIILFIDEIHTLVGSGSGEGSMDGGNIMKPALARGELQTIGATTLDEYRKYFEKDAALARRFKKVTVNEPTVEETVQILYGLRDRYEEYHEVTITDEAIVAAAELSSRYIHGRFLPDKAIDLIDEGSAKIKLAVSGQVEVDLTEIDRKLEEIAVQKKQAILDNTYTKASSLNAQEHTLIQERKEKVEQWQKDNPAALLSRVTEETIAELIFQTTGLPVAQITESETRKLLRMEKEMHRRVIGQNNAVKVLSRTIRRQRTGLKDPNRPIGSFIFAGPTGVGKTELAKTLSEFLFGNDKALITLDMSEYSEKHTVARLFGAPPGYVGYEEGGQLTEKIHTNPFRVVLFDEIEKAHPDVFDSLLQILEEGRLTDGQGRNVDFKNTVIVMTTNLGSAEIASSGIGFHSGEADASSEYETMKGKVNKALKDNFRPEFLNRLDEIVVFPHLSRDEIMEIVEIFTDKLAKRAEEENVTLVISAEAKARLGVIGYDKTLGARPLRRVIQREIETPLSEVMLFGKMDKKGVVKVDVSADNEFTFNGITHKELENEIETMDLDA